MKSILKTLLAFYLLVELNSCHSQQIPIIFESNEQDTATQLGKPQIFKLKKQTLNSDFNYSKLEDIDGNIKDTLNVKNVMPIFAPVSGQYKYYQFVSTFIGHANNGDGPPLLKDFHDILIIKTDNNNKIIDAYQYTLEWNEPPLEYNLRKSSNKNVFLTSDMDINQLKFIQFNMTTWSWNKEDEKLKEDGVIKLQ